MPTTAPDKMVKANSNHQANNGPGNLSQFLSSLTNHKPVRSLFTPPDSPLSTTNCHSNSSLVPSSKFTMFSSNSADHQSSATPISHCKHAIRFVGSTELRQRHTVPMLNWIVTELLYQSKCDGQYLHVKIRDCLRSADKFPGLRSQMISSLGSTGLAIHFELVTTPGHTGSAHIRIENQGDGQSLLEHSFKNVFIFGRYRRVPNVFYYLHKNQQDKQSRPTLYLFQVNSETQLKDIVMKYTELRQTMTVHNDRHLLLNSYRADVSSNSFEVLHVCSSVIAQRRISTTMVDKAAQIYRDNDNQNDSFSFELTEQDKQEQLDDAFKPMRQRKISDVTSSGKLKSRRQFSTNRFTVEVIDENEPLGGNTSASTSSSSSPREGHSGSGVEFNFCDSIPMTAKQQHEQTTPLDSVFSLVSNSQSLDCHSGKILLQAFNKQRALNDSSTFPKPSFQNDQIEAKSLAPPFLAPNHASSYSSNSLKRSSSGETNLRHDSILLAEKMKVNHECSAMPTNKTMLFIIAQVDVCLISIENHKTVLNKPFLNITHCCQGGPGNEDHFALVVREPCLPNYYKETFVVHVFKCQNRTITDELLSSLRQAFNNAYKANKMKLTGVSNVLTTDMIDQPSADDVDSAELPYCVNCPMNWFHNLCLDVDGLDDSTVCAFLLFRIKQSSSDEKRNEFMTILDALHLDQDGLRVDTLMILLKARVEKMQRKHEVDGCKLKGMTIYNQIDEQSNPVEESNKQSTSSLTKLEGLRLMAKNSLTNIFKKNFPSTENLPRSISDHNWSKPLSSITNKSSNSSQISLTDNIFLDEPSSQHIMPTSSNVDASTVHMLLRRNTVADCFPLDNLECQLELLTKEANEISKNPVKLNAESSPANEQTSQNVVSLNILPVEDRMNKRRRMRIYLKICGNQMALWSHDKLITKLRELEQQVEKRNRKVVFQNDSENIDSIEQNPKPLETSTKRNYAKLWENAVLQQILLNKMNKQNRRNECNHSSVTGNQVVHSYDDVPRLRFATQLSHQHQLWDRIIEKATVCQSFTAELDNEIKQCVCNGIPRTRKREIWRFLAAYARKDWGYYETLTGSFHNEQPYVNGVYRNLLRGLGLNHHSILIDLGRTFPEVPYFAESMGQGQLALFNILKAYSLFDKDVQYCQGLSFVAGILLIHMDEDEAFDLMCHLLYNGGIRSQYKMPEMDALNTQFYQLSRLLSDHNAQLFDFFEQNDVSPSLYAAPSFLTLFASNYSVTFVARLFDFLFLYGIDAIFLVMLSLLNHFTTLLLDCDGLEQIMEVVRHQMPKLSAEQMETIFERAFSTPQHYMDCLDRYRAEFVSLQREYMTFLSHQFPVNGEVGDITANGRTGHETSSSPDDEVSSLKQSLINSIERLQEEQRTNQRNLCTIQQLNHRIASLENERNELLERVSELELAAKVNASGR